MPTPRRGCAASMVWAFHLAPRPGDAPAGCELPGFDDGAWARIPVPANWELHGHGQPLYQKHRLSLPSRPLPGGSGRQSDRLLRPRLRGADGMGRPSHLPRVRLGRFLVPLLVNGVEVGFSTDSKLPAPSTSPRWWRTGSDHLAVRVYLWGTSSCLEKQGYWHLSGIQRSVRPVAKPAVHLRDWTHKVRFDAAFRDATLVARAWIAPPPGR